MDLLALSMGRFNSHSKMDLDGVRSRQGVVTVGSLYQKHETKVEPELEAIKEPSTGQKGKVQRVGKNPRANWKRRQPEI